jgi:hypothetical protein
MTTASIAGSSAALKVLYPKGELPKSIQDNFVTLKRMKKETDFVGESAYVALQNANPQGSSAQFSSAQANIYQGNYVRFNISRVSHYGVARVTGEAMEAAVNSEGALVDLWDNETKGIATTEMVCLATYLFGSGDGVLGRMSSGHTTATVTLAVGTNMNYFELNMHVGAVSALGLASTVRSGGAAKARISGIDRRNRTLTFTAALDTLITDVTATDYLVRAGDAHNTGTARVITGLDKLVEGGSAPGTLWGLNRDSDPLKLAGQAIDYTGWAMEDAIADASAQVGFHGVGSPKVLIANNIEVAALKKSMSAKIIFNRPGSSEGKYGFSGITIEGEDGPIEVVADPFCPRNRAYLVDLDKFCLWSLKAAPHLAKYDGLEFMRRPDEDAYEVRFAFYGQVKCKNPGVHVRLLNFGA